jgi:Cdc6-like AAA superfamily ATPase
MIEGLHNLTLAQFANELGKVVAAARPIAEPEHLKGRSVPFEIVEQAVMTAGKHVFIYGERGAGKTSLAKTAGLASASNRDEFHHIGCGPDSNFQSLIRQVLECFRPEILRKVERTKKASWEKFFSAGLEKKETSDAGQLDVSNVATVLADLDRDGWKTRRVVVIDEMEALPGEEAKKQFASLIKLLGDQGAMITIIFTGVGRDVDSILGQHLSAHRQLTQVNLNLLEFNDLLDIVDDALEKFRLDWLTEPTRSARFRIASIANGFPYYVHLLLDSVLYVVYRDTSAETVTLEHLKQAFTRAVTEAEAHVRKPYDKATRQRDEKYKLAVWATADSWDLERSTDEIYTSFKRLCELKRVDSITRTQFLQVLANLKRPNYGPILSPGYRKGFYKFTENFVRGYVRLCAASEDIELNDSSPSAARVVNLVHGRERRYVDPRKYDRPPRI